MSVMVVHEPGDWFETTLEALAAQDYPNLRTLFLSTADGPELEEVTARIRDVLPGAFVRPIGGNIGFGPAINEVLRLVEGDNGFFLVCHDDIAPEPTVVRTLVTELFRSNAGVVGPKLVDWQNPRLLQHVGLGLDRFGELDPVVEHGEVDQEQHDAVRDVFVLPSACLLVRADLFRALGGFDPAIDFHGDDVELCWRAHLTGARVIVAPDARVRHLEALSERRPDLPHRTLRSRHRMRSLAVLTGASRLLARSLQLLLLTLVELVVGLFTGRFGEALSSLRAVVGMVPRTGAVMARRRAIRGQRVVPEREILGLQDPGSSRLTSYLRGRETATYVGADATVRRWREASYGPVLAWFVVIAAIVIGSRQFIRDAVPPVGEFLAFPASPRDLWDGFQASFDGRGFGATAAQPTGYAILALSSVVTLFHMELLLTLSIVGLYVLGAVGAWRLATVFPANRARIAGMVVYVGTPLVPGLLARGDWSALAWYAALPWLVHLLRRAAGLDAADPMTAELDLADGVAPVGIRHRLRSLAFLTLVLAVTAAFVPIVVVLWAVVGILLAVATLVAAGSWRVALWLAGCTAVSTVLAYVLNLPWAFEWSWADLMGVRPAGATGRTLAEVATLTYTGERFAVLALALYLPLLAAITITRAWRLTWSVRAAALVLVFGALLVFGQLGSIEQSLPAPAMLAVPIALGLALGGAAIAGGFGSDVLARGFGWRQPVAVLANMAIVVGLVPAALAIGDGSWHAPRSPMPELLEAQVPLLDDGDYRVLYVGDPRLLPVPGREYRDGIAFAVTDAGALDFTDRFPTPRTEGDDAVVEALDLIATGSTLRVGSVLAPLGIRYVIVPETDGVVSTPDEPIPVPDGLVASLQNQLDIGSVPGQPSLEVFQNEAWMPVGAQLTGETATASRQAGAESLVRADLSQFFAAMFGADEGVPSGANEVVPGVVHVAIPFDERIELEVDGRTLEPRPGFGVTTAFDIDSSGTGRLEYVADGARGWWIAGQVVLWLVVLAIAAGARAPFSRRRSGTLSDETLIDLGDDELAPAGVVGEALGAPWHDHDADELGGFDEPGWPDVPAGSPGDRDHDHPGGLTFDHSDERPGAAPGPPPTMPPPPASAGHRDAPGADRRPGDVRPSDAPPMRAPRPGDRTPPSAGGEDDDEVDLAGLVSEVEAAERARDRGSSSATPSERADGGEEWS